MEDDDSEAPTTLTDGMVVAARATRERLLKQLLETQELDADMEQRNLERCWHVSYQGLKPLLRSLLTHERYAPVAAYIMERFTRGMSASKFRNLQAAMLKN